MVWEATTSGNLFFYPTCNMVGMVLIIEVWCNGSIADFDSVRLGSNPDTSTYFNVMKLVNMRDSIPSQMKSNLGCIREKLMCGVVK